MIRHTSTGAIRLQYVVKEIGFCMQYTVYSFSFLAVSSAGMV
jgi:hypothetical protein